MFFVVVVVCLLCFLEWEYETIGEKGDVSTLWSDKTMALTHGNITGLILYKADARGFIER